MATTTLRLTTPSAGTSAAGAAVIDEHEQVDVGELFTEHAPFLLRVIERLTGRGAHVEDIVQDVFIVAHKKRHILRKAEVRGWLYRVARNSALHHKRSLFRFFRLRDAVKVEPVSSSPIAAADDAAHKNRQGQRIRRCALALPFNLREVFVLHELEGLETQTIAALLEVPEGTVWSRLSSARAAFKTIWLREEQR